MSYRELHRFLVHWKEIWCCKTVKWGHAAEAALGNGCVLISLFNWKKRNEGKNDGSHQMNKLEFILWAWSCLPTCVVSFYLSWKKYLPFLGPYVQQMILKSQERDVPLTGDVKLAGAMGYLAVQSTYRCSSHLLSVHAAVLILQVPLPLDTQQEQQGREVHAACCWKARWVSRRTRHQQSSTR